MRVNSSGGGEPDAAAVGLPHGRLLTRGEAMALLRLKRSHFSRAVNGRIRGLPRIPVVEIGRRQLFRRESINQSILDVEACRCAGRTRSGVRRRSAFDRAVGEPYPPTPPGSRWLNRGPGASQAIRPESELIVSLLTEAAGVPPTLRVLPHGRILAQAAPSGRRSESLVNN
jgi:hypothetical protein